MRVRVEVQEDRAGREACRASALRAFDPRHWCTDAPARVLSHDTTGLWLRRNRALARNTAAHGFVNFWTSRRPCFGLARTIAPPPPPGGAGGATLALRLGPEERCDVNEQPLFLHERLIAYKISREFYVSARAISKQLPRGLADLGDQLTRAARSSSLAIAEGAGARSVRIKRTFFERAVASEAECAACLDQVLDDEAAPPPLVAKARQLLERATRLTLGLIR